MATKNLKTTKSFDTSIAPVEVTIGTRALYPDERMPNDVKETQYQSAKPTRNTKRYHTTITSPENADTPCIDDMILGAPSDRQRPAEFETVVERQAWRKGIGRTTIAEWQQVNGNLTDPHATNRTAISPVQGWHKGPLSHVYSDAENKQISSGGQVDHYSKLSSYKSPIASKN